MPSSERAAATPAHAPAGRATREATAAAVAVAAPGRENRLLGPARERAEVALEGRQREVAATVVPGRRGNLEALKIEDPALGHAERDRPWQPPMERVGRHPLEPILLGPLEELLEPAHLRQDLHAGPGLARHDPAPGDEDEPAADDPDSQPWLVQTKPGRSELRQEQTVDRGEQARRHPSGSHAARRGGKRPSCTISW